MRYYVQVLMEAAGYDQEMRNMADREGEKTNCFGRCPVPCSILICTLLVVSVVVSGLSAGLYVQTVRPAVARTIAENVVLTEGSAGFPQFMSSSAPLFSYYYMLNITNPKLVQQGRAKPHLTQIGPFVYKENRTKYDPLWEDKDGGGSQDVLKYSLMINYTLDPALSHAADPKRTFVTTINIPLMGILLELEQLEDRKNGTVKFFLEEVFKLVDATLLSGEGLFITKSVHELLWGYEDKVLKRIKTLQDDFNKLHLFSPIHILDQTVFGFGNLSSVETPNRVYTGANDTKFVGKFIEWNGVRDIAGWGTAAARSINGTGGFMFHPGVTREENLTAFINELYRSGYFSYKEDIDMHGIQLYKFVLPPNELQNDTQDSGFNANGPSGVLNLTAVVPSNIPLFASKPHFLDADPAYLTNISGLSPDRDKHDSYLATEPLTGAVLDAAKRIQVNFRLSNFSHLSQLTKLKPVTMLPVYWVAQTGTITPELASEFKSVVYMARDGVEGVMWALTGVAGVVAVLCVLCLAGVMVEMVKKRSSSQRGHQRIINTNYSETSPLLTGNN